MDANTGLKNFFDRSQSRYEAFEKAWKKGRDMDLSKRRRGPFLVPYVGSGLNQLATNGIRSWSELVNAVEAKCGDLGLKFRVRRTLTFPQHLEFLLRKADSKTDLRDLIVAEFRKAFDKTPDPSNFHHRILEMFPVLLTTNYNRILDIPESKQEVVDLTDPDRALKKFPPGRSTVFHLHGIWPTKKEHHSERIFWGVGDSEVKDGPCLVLTENQYHRLYGRRRSYQQSIRRIFDSQAIMLFLGASLSNDETGIHAALRERKMRGKDFAGVYVGLDLDEVKCRLLEARGLEPISLPKRYGFSREAGELQLHAFLDECDKRFSKREPDKRDPVLKPEILCVGLSSWNQVGSLREIKRTGKEAAHTLASGNYIEEPGGQHLYPALHLVERGHRTAIATPIGEDELGDLLLDRVRSFAESCAKDPSCSGDLLLRFVRRDKNTRRSIVITHGGTRVIYDHDGENGMSTELLSAELYRWKDIKAIYLGSYFHDFQEQCLEDLGSASLRFFETGTKGPRLLKDFKRVLNIARGCNYVISSSDFLMRIVDAKRFSANLDTVDCQNLVWKNFRNKGAWWKKGFDRLWSTDPGRKVLVVVMGKHGSFVVTEDASGAIQPRLVKPRMVGRAEAVNWLGCGDLFRGEFIHQILQDENIDPVSAAEAASEAVAEKIKRMHFSKRTEAAHS